MCKYTPYSIRVVLLCVLKPFSSNLFSFLPSSLPPFRSVTGEYGRFPDETEFDEASLNYFISELNFDAVDEKLLVGAA